MRQLDENIEIYGEMCEVQLKDGKEVNGLMMMDGECVLTR